MTEKTINIVTRWRNKNTSIRKSGLKGREIIKSVMKEDKRGSRNRHKRI
jgi:hypothetical protein